MRRLAMASVALVALSGCAGHEPRPVSMYQVGDNSRSCEELKYEITANEQTIADLQDSKFNRNIRNGFVAAGGIFVPVLLLGLDMQESQEAEISALETRNAVLANKVAECDIRVVRPVGTIN